MCAFLMNKELVETKYWPASQSVIAVFCKYLPGPKQGCYLLLGSGCEAKVSHVHHSGTLCGLIPLLTITTPVGQQTLLSCIHFKIFTFRSIIDWIFTTLSYQ